MIQLIPKDTCPMREEDDRKVLFQRICAQFKHRMELLRPVIIPFAEFADYLNPVFDRSDMRTTFIVTPLQCFGTKKEDSNGIVKNPLKHVLSTHNFRKVCGKNHWKRNSDVCVTGKRRTELFGLSA